MIFQTIGSSTHQRLEHGAEQRRTEPSLGAGGISAWQFVHRDNEAQTSSVVLFALAHPTRGEQQSASTGWARPSQRAAKVCSLLVHLRNLPRCLRRSTTEPRAKPATRRRMPRVSVLADESSIGSTVSAAAQSPKDGRVNAEKGHRGRERPGKHRNVLPGRACWVKNAMLKVMNARQSPSSHPFVAEPSPSYTNARQSSVCSAFRRSQR